MRYKVVLFVLGEVLFRQINTNHCGPLRYDGDQVMMLMDGDDNTCMPDAVDSNVQLAFRVSSPRALQVIKILGYNLSCSPSRGLMVQYNPHCAEGSTCKPPHEVCQSQHAALQMGTQGIKQCSYLCQQRNRNSLFVVSHFSNENTGPRLCEIVVE